MRNFISAVIAAFVAPITTAAEAFCLGDRLSAALPTADEVYESEQGFDIWAFERKLIAKMEAEYQAKMAKAKLANAMVRDLHSEAAYQAWAAIERAEFFGLFGLEFARQDAAYLGWESNLLTEELMNHLPMAEVAEIDLIVSGLLAHEDEVEALLEEQEEAKVFARQKAVKPRQAWMANRATWAAATTATMAAHAERQAMYGWAAHVRLGDHAAAVAVLGREWAAWATLSEIALEAAEWAPKVDRRSKRQQGDKVRARALRAARRAAEPQFPEAIEAIELETEEEALDRVKDAFNGVRQEMMAVDRRGLGANGISLYVKMKGDMLA